VFFFRCPPIILLDEATSALDAESESQVQQALDNLVYEMQTKCTVLIIAHRLSTVMNADKICVVQDGQIVEQGTHSSLMDSNGTYATLVRRQITKSANEIKESNII